MDKSQLRDLLERYADNKASKEEVEEMLGLLRQVKNDRELRDLIAATGVEKSLETELPQENWDKMWKAITLATIIHEENFFQNKKPVSKNKIKAYRYF